MARTLISEVGTTTLSFRFKKIKDVTYQRLYYLLNRIVTLYHRTLQFTYEQTLVQQS